MLIAEIKTKMLSALKGGRSLEKEILSVALGELQTIEARKGELTDEEAQAIVRKLIKSNRETIEASQASEQRATLEQEIAILEALLPKALGPEELALKLGASAAAIRAAASDGQATGIAMKAFKAEGITVDGKLVGEVVKRMRA